eukprot:tig00001067_g6759.t1
MAVPRLSFAFPGFLSISLEEAPKLLPAPAPLLRLPAPSLAGSPAKKRRSEGSNCEPPSASDDLSDLFEACEPEADDDDDGATINDLPPDLIAIVFSHLDAKSLCRAARVSLVWSAVAARKELWKPLVAADVQKYCGVQTPLLDADGTPHWRYLCAYGHLMRRVSDGWAELAKGWDYLSDAFIEIATHVDGDGVGPSADTSATIAKIVKKLAKRSWGQLYDSLGTLLALQAERLCLEIEAEQEAARRAIVPSGQAAAPYSLLAAVVARYARFRTWLRVLNSFCGELNYEAGQARDNYSYRHTPTVFQKGLIAFRSRVLLARSLRPRLQAATSQRAVDRASDRQMDALVEFNGMLEEVNVLDDSGATEKRSQGKLNKYLLQPLQRSLVN